eukprot:1740278-Alexandrium_andersonii.AAC.1
MSPSEMSAGGNCKTCSEEVFVEQARHPTKASSALARRTKSSLGAARAAAKSSGGRPSSRARAPLAGPSPA